MNKYKFLVTSLLLFSVIVYDLCYGGPLVDQCPRHDFVGSRKCTKRCEDDGDCKSKKKSCECDGVCGRTCVNPNQRCEPTPRNVPNGRVDILPFNKFGAVARYTCVDGYTLVGIPARVCQGDETWSGEEPQCEHNHKFYAADRSQSECYSPPKVHHAHHNGSPGATSFPHGSNLLYQCDAGYVLLKDNVLQAWCVGNDLWVGPKLTCVSATAAAGCDPATPIDNGSVLALGTNGVGDEVEYRCDSGFFLLGNKTRTCQKDGTWDGHEPSCATVVCGPPPHVEHAGHDAEKGTFRFATGTVLNYVCSFGYYREGSPRAICTGPKGVWSGPAMSCKARDCGSPGEVNNGFRDPGYRFMYPTRVTYYCHEGYELKGRGYRECMANGEWGGALPVCEPIHCLELRPPLHGTMIGAGTAYGANIRFVCNEGYRVVGSSERTCQADRTWSGQDAFCEEIDCGMPEPLWNGYLDGHRTVSGSVYFFRCNLRTKMQGESVTTTCKENGQWTHPTPKCLGQCLVPEITNGSIIDGTHSVWVDSGTVIVPRCKDGLVLNDTTQVTCYNGTWNLIPRCVPAPCSDPPPLVDNGHRVFFGVRHGDRARYFCVEGYKLENGSHYLTCQYGHWVGPPIACLDNFCENPGEIANGQVYKIGANGRFTFRHYIETIKHGTRLEYECNRNYKLSGPKGAACVNGRWSPEEKPRCVRSRHPVFHKLWKPVEEQQPTLIYRHR